MAPEVGAAIIAAVAATCAAVFSYVGQLRTARLTATLSSEQRREDRAHEAARVLARYREPLLHAAYDLQSRLYNVLRQGFAQRYIRDGSPLQQAYGVENTAFVVAQYFAWVEIVRREVQFLDLGEQSATKRLSALQDDIRRLWATDQLPEPLRVFAGDQRAIGERMIHGSGATLECMGYADFADLMRTTPERIPAMTQVREDIRRLVAVSESDRERLYVIQHALIELMAYLDPDCVRFPRGRRTRAGSADDVSSHEGQVARGSRTNA